MYVQKRSHVAVKDVTKTYPRFEFQGLREAGYCHLRIHIRNGVPFFLCSKLLNYFGPSITAFATAIRRQAISALYDEGVITPTRHDGVVARLLFGDLQERHRKDIVEYFFNRSIWIRHNSPDNCYYDEDSYAFLDFSTLFPDMLELEAVVETTGLDRSFFLVPSSELLFAPLEAELE